MSTQNTCRICSLVDIIKKKRKKKFESKMNDETFQKSVLDIGNEKHSFEDIKNQLIEDNPTWKEALISIPTTLLLKYMKQMSDTM